MRSKVVIVRVSALLHHNSDRPVARKKPTREEIERLAILAIGNDEAGAIAHFENVQAQQYSFETLLAYFIAPAAQYLSELWKQDLCDFFDVTVGEVRLQAIMDRFGSTDASSSPILGVAPYWSLRPAKPRSLASRWLRGFWRRRLGRDIRAPPSSGGSREGGRRGIGWRCGCDR